MNGPAPKKFRDPALVDFGVDQAGFGRRLERLGGVLVDRPLPQSAERRRFPATWRSAQAVYRQQPAAGSGPRGDWEVISPLPDPWMVACDIGCATLALEVHPAPSGQVGVFIEQIEQWRWLAGTARPGSAVLSLFAHSGGATLAAAAAGAEVVHVDASRQAIALARRNAEASGLAHLPIAWVCEDATTFVRRCLKRGRRFHGVALDPPSWGHGPKGQSFAIDRDLPGLLVDVARLLGPSAAGPLLLTCHSPGWHPRRLQDTLVDACHTAGTAIVGRQESGALACSDESGRRLDLGTFARVNPSS